MEIVKPKPPAAHHGYRIDQAEPKTGNSALHISASMILMAGIGAAYRHAHKLRYGINQARSWKSAAKISNYRIYV
jgi:hypothetical protein